MSKSVYSEKMVAELVAKPEWSYAEAVAYAEANGIKVRSVIAKVKSLGLAYEPKPVVNKVGEPVERKAEVVAEIAEAVGVAESALAGLVKAPKEALNALRAAVVKAN